MTRGATQHLYVSHAGDTDGMEDAAIYKVRLMARYRQVRSAGKLPGVRPASSIDCRNRTAADWR
jgi:hypothetical protein